MLESARQELGPIFAFMERLCCGASVIDRQGRIVGVNDRMCIMMGRNRQQVEGRLVSEFYSDPAARAKVQAGISNFNISRETEFYTERPDGSHVPMISLARVLGDAPPLSDYRLVTMIDITAQKQAERQAQEQYRHISELSDTIIAQALELKAYNQSLEQKVRQRTEELRLANLDSIYMLAVASEAKDLDTGRHVRRIQSFSQTLALELGMDEPMAEAIGYGSILHDVGKMHVPDQVLKKPGPLTPEERLLMQEHTVVGQRIISGGTFFEFARRIARSHHENFDGSGYPDKLAGEQIPIEARIVHLVDVYDALVHARAYKPAWTPADALEHVQRQAGAMFDPRVAEAFVRGFEKQAFNLPEQQGS